MFRRERLKYKIYREFSRALLENSDISKSKLMEGYKGVKIEGVGYVQLRLPKNGSSIQC